MHHPHHHHRHQSAQRFLPPTPLVNTCRCFRLFPSSQSDSQANRFSKATRERLSAAAEQPSAERRAAVSRRGGPPLIRARLLDHRLHTSPTAGGGAQSAPLSDLHRPLRPQSQPHSVPTHPHPKIKCCWAYL